MKYDQLHFAQVYDCRLGPIGKGHVLQKCLTHPEDNGEGCYLVTVGTEVVYLGSYKRGLHRRWGYKNKDEIYHFKTEEIGRAIIDGGNVKVWGLTLSAIKEQIGCVGNKWINAASVEAYLISKYRPVWNKQGKRQVPFD